MKYTTEITIDLPRDRMMEIFDNPDNMEKWMDGLQEWEVISGEPGTPGAQMRMKFLQGKREIDMVETIVERNMPEEFHVIYEAQGVKNWANNYFTEVSPDKTRWKAEHEFKFGGFMRIMSFFMPTSMFQKQTLKNMNDFKAFAESQ